MANWFDLLAYKDRYKEFLKEAESNRLMQAAAAAQPAPIDTIPGRLTSWLGEHLIDWGNRLLERQQNCRVEHCAMSEKTG